MHLTSSNLLILSELLCSDFIVYNKIHPSKFIHNHSFVDSHLFFMLKVCWYGQILLKDSIFFLNDRAVSILKFPFKKFVDKIEESIEKAIQNCGQTK